MIAPTCGTKGCNQPCQRFKTGSWAVQCAKHKHESQNRSAYKRRWHGKLRGVKTS